MTEFNDGYDDFLNEAGKDDRVGKHRVIVTKIGDGEYEGRNGDAAKPYKEIKFKMSSGSEIDLRWVKPPDVAPSKELLKLMDRAVSQGIVQSVTLRRQLAQHFGKSFENLHEGDALAINVELRKSKKDGKYYPRVVAFIPADDAKAVDPNEPPF